MSSALLLRLSSLGDIAKSLPLVSLLADRGWRIGWLVEQRFAELLSLATSPVECLVWKRGLIGIWNLRGKGKDFDCVLDIQGNGKSGLLAAVLGCPVVYAPNREDLRERWNLWLKARRAPPAPSPHVLDRSLAVLSRVLGEELCRDDLGPPPHLEAPEEARVRLAADLERIGIPPDEPLLAIVSRRPDDPRAWPLQRAVELSRAWQGPSLLLLGPGERPVCPPPGVLVLRQQKGELGLLVALGRHLREGDGRAVGHDGGAMHVLHAAGARCLFLFGPQDPGRTGPLGGQTRQSGTLQAPIHLACRPCLSRSCRLPEGPRCMAEITADRALEELLML
ncbi:MAG: glycosyltransferase family 9 protein [Planctomycetota bacterium]